MEIRRKRVVVTGGGSGIGEALAAQFVAKGACAVAVVDIDLSRAAAVAGVLRTKYPHCDVSAHRVDVGSQEAVQSMVDAVTKRFGGIDIFCSNAGVMVRKGLETTDVEWRQTWGVNVMGHVHAANSVMPQMLERGSGYFVNTVSAAGLLSQIGSASYSMTKHAAIGFAEWLSIAYHDRGIRVSCLCPQGVRTPMLLGKDGTRKGFLQAGALDPERVAELTIDGIRAERFLILPHEEVLEYYRRKGQDYDRWLSGMRRLKDRVEEEFGHGI
ncbi:SDR family NAD(P)-dependent oxidoreductase [Cupriavidus pauculus]|uniref:SDR family NAD(P)-dependent oxidoreductase n=1 Tax=Cupriavidus pauculus TaxID=82633 RepID=A0A5P2HEU0_9BURK|nr:SDR family NAD(P)-dependent oxidoreductase [Cupriavidus pauculus]QET06114.1 SDR family NAD(P)-dependent oxidoreductase [Cupriavidus pauculus]